MMDTEQDYEGETLAPEAPQAQQDEVPAAAPDAGSSPETLDQTIRGVIERESAPEPEEQAREQDPPFHHHPRWQEMRAKMADLQAKLDQAQARLAELTQKAPQIPQEVLEALSRDPEQGREALEQYLREQKIARGEMLPEDLQDEVEAGNMTEEHARELARLRHEARSYRQEVERQAAYAKRLQLERTAMAVSEMENRLAASDPSYKTIQPMVEQLYRARVMGRIMAGGDPADQAWALQALNEAVNEARAFASSLVARRPTQAAPPARGSAAPIVQKRAGEPRSLKEIIEEQIMNWGSR